MNSNSSLDLKPRLDFYTLHDDQQTEDQIYKIEE